MEWYKPQYEERIYWVCWSVMAACLCFRFGQGVDYITYHAIYETIPTAIDISQGYICGFYPEVGWRLLCALFKVFHAPFWVLTMTIGLAEMLLVHRFLRKYVPMKVAGLFLLYPVLYVTYMISGLRQGLAMCLFLGVLLPFYLQKKWIQYIVGVILVSSFHKVGYTWLILVIAYYLPVWVMAALTGFSIMAGVILQIDAIQQFIVNLIPAYHVKQFLLENDISIFAVGERLISFGVLFVLYLWLKTHRTVEQKTELMLKAYMCGVCFYMLMFGNAYYASRYAIIFKVIECAVVIALVRNREFLEKGVFIFFFGLTIIMGCKNLNAMVNNCGYKEYGKNFLNCPYVSVFNQDAILEYVPYEERMWEIYGYNIEDQQLWMIEE